MEETVDFEELSQELRKGRLAKKWRPRDIARRTRIQYEYVKLIESGDFTFMPDPIIRGYIKSYARDVGLDQNEMIQKYEQAKANAQTPTPEPQKPEVIKQDEKKFDKLSGKDKTVEGTRLESGAESKAAAQPKTDKELPEEKDKGDEKRITRKKPDSIFEKAAETAKPVQAVNKPEKDEKISESEPGRQKEKDDQPKPKKSGTPPPPTKASPKPEDFYNKHKNELIFAGIIFIAIVAIVLFYLKFGTEYFSKTEEPVKKISVFEAREQTMEKDTLRKAKLEEIRLPETVKLRVLAAEQTWVRMIVDSSDTSEYMFSPGTSRTFEAKNQIELKMGRADGLFIWVNGDSLGKLGSAAEIVRKLVINPQGIVTKQLRKPPPPKPAKKDSAVIL